jgi:hypothetical protein
MSEHRPGGKAQRSAKPRQQGWQEMLEGLPAMRQVFHVLCDMGEGEDATELLGFAARQEFMADLARRAESVAWLADTIPLEPEYEDLQVTLWELYAASRVRDALLLAHQPGPALATAGELDDGLDRNQPGCRPVPVDQIMEFFAPIGCRPVTEARFDPILHEIITCGAAAEPDAPIQVTGHAWPALMVGEPDPG